jgi:hypothetical protein
MRLALLFAVMFSSSLVAADSAVVPPEGETGIAAKYKGDAGLAQDPSVVFSEDYEEASIDALKKRWDTIAAPERQISFEKDVPVGSAGKQSLLINSIGGLKSPFLYRRLMTDANGHDRLFVRFYVKFDGECAGLHHGPMKVGGNIAPQPWPMGGSGKAPDGTDHFTVTAESYADAWRWDFYNYWCRMRGVSGGNFWGNDLVNDTDWKVVKDAWICVEQMIKLNTVGDADGELAFWIDGQLRRKDGQIISHLGKGFPKGKWRGDSWHPDPNGEAFEGFELRTVDNLRINYLLQQVYITKSAPESQNKVWYDDLVVATKYIGPMRK